MKYIIGIDFGGTNIKLGLVNQSGKIVCRDRLDTRSCIQSKTLLITNLVQKINNLLQSNHLSAKQISGIGIGLPGLIDPVQGIVKFLPNVPGWKNVPLVQILEKKLNIPTYIDNDVNLVALGEWEYGAGAGYANLVCLTLGTGVGGGLILDGRLYRGEGYVAGEVGHMPLNEDGPKCNCPGTACLERYVGNRTLEQKAARLFNKENITLEEVYALADQSDEKAIQFWNETATHIGNGLIGLVNLLNPRVIVLGGGVANAFKFIKGPLTKIIKARSMTVQSKMVKIVRAQLGDDAGIIGAQILIKDLKHKVSKQNAKNK